MTTTPKWYCRNKSQAVHTFPEITKLGLELRRITKRIVIDVKVDIFTENDSILEECEKVIETYWELKDETKNQDYLSLTKKYKRSPYNALLLKKYTALMELNDRRFCQLTFVLKKTLSYLLRKSNQSEIWLNWALQISQIYNKCGTKTTNRNAEDDNEDTNKDKSNKESELNANICSNMFPGLLLPHKLIDFSYVLQLVSQSHIEQNALDLMFGLFNIVEDHAWQDTSDSNCSSLEILRILTLNMTGDGDYQMYYDGTTPITPPSQRRNGNFATRPTNEFEGNECQALQSSRSKHVEYFLQKERIFIAQLITKANLICPSIFGSDDTKTVDLQNIAVRGMRLIWSNVGIVLDHIMLWWIDTPISCYALTHVDSIRNWLTLQNVTDIPEPVFSTLRGIGEILTNFVCINIWDQLFRLTLVSSVCARDTVDNLMQNYRSSPRNHLGTPTGTVWVAVFSNLISLSNSFFPYAEAETTSLMPVAEQIPILHRVDHSVHSMRLWVLEQAKLLCGFWKMDRFFQILEHDVQSCLRVFITFKLPKLTADISVDVLMLVCVALRAKLVTEVNANIDKLKKTTDECVHILSSICRVLCLAHFTLCLPNPQYWQQTVYDNEKSGYVDYLLDQMLLPTIKATHDIVILKLILKIICEAWLDYIYKRRIRFSVNGAVRLLNDFDEVREWIQNCSLLDDEQVEKLTNHDVLRMCKGVGKILLRKPEDVISITQSPKYDRKGGGDSTNAANETQLPSEMFVSNQKHWLQLRASNSNFHFWKLCCGD